MRSPLRAVMLLMALAMLIGAAAPPVIEDHLEAGFCSADCPVQHAGHTVAMAPPPAPSVDRRWPAVVIAGAHLPDVTLVAARTPDAPRAPPVA